MSTFREFSFAIGVSVACLAGAFAWGGPRALFIAAILGVLELSLSFDNAVVNAAVLRNMSAIWQRRFLTWGIAIAVFGMRIIFPVVIVALVARLGLVEVVQMAFTDAEEYARNLEEAHVSIASFGGMFLFMVFIKYYMDPEKEVHWIVPLERALARAGKLDTVQVLIAGAVLLAVTQFLASGEDKLTAITSGLFGILIYTLIDGLSNLFDSEAIAKGAANAGLMSFLYLEVLDASFSLDGVIGAFAITQDIVIIAVGLAIGAVFVRSLTLLLVHRGTLAQYVFLEHGAHYGIGALAIIMLITIRFEVPELITGIIGVAFIGFALLSSVLFNRRGGSPTGPTGEAV